MNFLGIKPGKGLALVAPDGTPLRSEPMGGSEVAIYDQLRSFSALGVRLAMVERGQAFSVHRSDKPGLVIGATHLLHCGFLRGLLRAAEIPVEDVPSITWQRFMNAMSWEGGGRAKQRAHSVFPGWQIFHSTAGALLIAEYARLKTLGMLPKPVRAARPTPADPRQSVLAMPNREEVEDF
jgi:hypothetical protein